MTERRLAAILVADVVGYSKLIGSDEAGTLAQLQSLRNDLIEPQLAKHAGRLFKSVGDGFLIEFASAVQAVNCAVAIQKANPALPLRIGVHVGDVVVQGDDLLGDGVNVAARIEGVAEAGGIALSRQVYDQVRDRLDLSFIDKGEIELKNIIRPVQVFVVASAKVSSEPSALPLPDKPSIAVLPFQNMSADPDQDYFADGMVEDIITALSRTKTQFVIARNSSFSYKGKSLDIRQVGRELGVRYILEGSVRKAGQRLRITGQLIEADKGTHIWADRFEGDLKDVFELQDRVASNVVASILPSVELAEFNRVRTTPTANLVAYDHFLRGRESLFKFTSASTEEALVNFRKAIDLDPGFALAFAHAALCYAYRKAWGWRESKSKDETEDAEKLIRQAFVLDRSHPRVLAIGGWVIGFVLGRLDEGAALIETAVDLDPNFFMAWNYRGWIALGRGDQSAKDYFQHALRLNPRDPALFTIQAGMAAASFFSGRYDDAVQWATQVLVQHPRQMSVLWFYTAALALLDRTDEACLARSRIQDVIPRVRLSNVRNWLMAKHDDILADLIKGLRLAGLPE